MSDVSPARDLGPPRSLRKKELALIKRLLAGTPYEKGAVPRLAEARVQDMQDGGMQSIRFFNPSSEKRIFAKEIAEGLFHDADGIPVSVALNSDQFGDLFELDVWKVNFSPLIRYPAIKDVEIVERHS
jgi:hypothetical protein